MNVVERSHVADHLWVWWVRLSKALGTKNKMANCMPTLENAFRLCRKKLEQQHFVASLQQ